MAGRNTKLTEEAIEDFCGAIGIGATIKAACANANITFQTYRNWQIRGEEARAKRDNGEKITKDERLPLEFLESVEEAQAMALLNWQNTIEKAARVDPAWAWKMLQVRAPEDYAVAPQRIEHTGEGGGPVRITTIEVHHIPSTGND